MEFAKIIKKGREKNFKFPKTFYSQADLSYSYGYYLQIERGEKVPTAEEAIKLLELFGCDIKTGLYAWVRDQFQSEEHKAMFRTNLHQLKTTKPQPSSLAINRMQAKLLKKSPLYWEVLTFINAYSHAFKPDLKTIAENFKITEEVAGQFVTELFEHGLSDRNADGSYVTKEWVFIPYEEEYAHLRDENFKRAYERFWKQPSPNRFRTTHTRTVTPAQKEQIQQNIMSLLDEVTDMPDDPSAKAFTLGIFSSDRNFEPL
jgi:hypothetical protein